MNFAKKNNIYMTIVGPEAPLVDGIVDLFKRNGLRIFGPSKKAANLEGSKAYAKDFMKKYNVRTAEYEVFQSSEKALSYLQGCGYPVVIKADGLALGKGVAICENLKEAESCIQSFMVEDVFKGAGRKIVIEEFLQGVEASILAITDGETMIPFMSAKDHKTIYEDNEGPNTGGMGAIAPNPYVSKEVLAEFEKHIMIPTLQGIQEERLDYTGIVFFGIMITGKGVYLLEYNVRMGDPETQAVLPLMESDFVDLIDSALEKDLENYKIYWKKAHACGVVAASGGYPEAYSVGFNIEGMKEIYGKIFISGAVSSDEHLVTSGGRVLTVTNVETTLDRAREKTYEDMKKVTFKDIYYRKDIGEI